jgi:hypothetical protein
MRFDSKGASQYLKDTWGINASPKTLANHRSKGTGPHYSRAGIQCNYGAEDLDAWAQSRLSAPVRNTTEERLNGVKLPPGNPAAVGAE